MLILIGKHGANGQLMSLTMVGPSGSKGEPNGLKVESYPMVASSGKRSFLSVDLMPADESGKRSGFYIMEYAFEDQARLLKLRHMDYNAIRDLIGKRDLKGEINEPPVAATKPGAEPEPTEIKGTIELHERSKRLREILLQHPEVFDGDWIRLKRISAEEFDRIGDSSKSRDAEHPEFAQWPVVLPAAFGCLLLGIVCGFWFARKRSSVAGGGNP